MYVGRKAHRTLKAWNSFSDFQELKDCFSLPLLNLGPKINKSGQQRWKIMFFADDSELSKNNKRFSLWSFESLSSVALHNRTAKTFNCSGCMCVLESFSWVMNGIFLSRSTTLHYRPTCGGSYRLMAAGTKKACKIISTCKPPLTSCKTSSMWRWERGETVGRFLMLHNTLRGS